MAQFHLAIPVDDLEKARAFYAGDLGCDTGRESDIWIDFNFFGHQVTAHLDRDLQKESATNPVDGDQVPIRHFGLILDRAAWDEVAARLKAAGTPFIIEPRLRFEGQVGEQGTFFVRDPAGNALEFKTFADMGRVFER